MNKKNIATVFTIFILFSFLSCGNLKNTKGQSNTESAAELFEKGMEYLSMESPDYENAMKYFTNSAEKGYGPAYRELGCLYYRGLGIERDDLKAYENFLKAREKDDIEASLYLGYMFANGDFVDQNGQKAETYFKEAAEHGELASAYNLGYMYYTGKLIEKDYDKSLYWLRKISDKLEEAKELLAEVEEADAKSKIPVPNSPDDFEFIVNDDFTKILITKYIGTRKDVIIPKTIEDIPVIFIEASCFEGTDITSIVIPENCNLGAQQFYDCESLKKVVLPEGMEYIPGYCFYNCKNLQDISIPSSVKAIGVGAFGGCEKLTAINYPTSLKYIGPSAFYGVGLTVVDIPEGVEFLCVSAFCDVNAETFHLPKSIKYIPYYVGKEGEKNYVFSSKKEIKSVTFAEGFSPYFDESGYESGTALGLFRSESIKRDIKLQKQLSEIKIKANSRTPTFSYDKLGNLYGPNKKIDYIKKNGKNIYLYDERGVFGSYIYISKKWKSKF